MLAYPATIITLQPFLLFAISGVPALSTVVGAYGSQNQMQLNEEKQIDKYKYTEEHTLFVFQDNSMLSLSVLCVYS